MQRLRHTSTRRLVALSAGVLAIAAGGTAIAVAAGGTGPVPAPEPLAAAIHDALAAPAVQGVTARIHFTNRLVDSSMLGDGADPLLSGGDGRLWASADGRARLELQTQGGTGDTQVVLDGRRLEVVSASTDTVYRLTPPAGQAPRAGARAHAVPPLARIQRALARLARRLDVSGAIPGDVAGRAAYTVRVSPRQAGGLLGAAELAWDAANGTPLRAAVYARGDATPVLELEATDVSFGPVDAGALSVQPPAGAKVVDLTGDAAHVGHGTGHARPVSGLAAVRAAAGFAVRAPAALAGRPRTSARLVRSGSDPAVLLTYGRGLGAIVVLESPAKAGPAGARPRDGGLPTVTLDGARATVVETALGTVVSVRRDGVALMVAGSVHRAAALAAARAL